MELDAQADPFSLPLDFPPIPFDLEDIGAGDDGDFHIEDGQPRWRRGSRLPHYRRHHRPAARRQHR